MRSENALQPYTLNPLPRLSFKIRHHSSTAIANSRISRASRSSLAFKVPPSRGRGTFHCQNSPNERYGSSGLRSTCFDIHVIVGLQTSSLRASIKFRVHSLHAFLEEGLGLRAPSESSTIQKRRGEGWRLLPSYVKKLFSLRWYQS